jgi:hypothetical protein
MTADLFEDHRVIVAISEELFALVRRTPAPTLAELTEVRSRLGIRAAQHLRDEDAIIVRPLLASGRADELPGAMEAIAAIREARARYSNHVGKWTLAAIHADLPGYAEDLVGMIDYLKRVVAMEERDLYWPALRLLNAQTTPSNIVDESLRG